jgi:hypothetical protein
MKPVPALLLAAFLGVAAGSARAQSVVFDFDGGPIHAPLPLDQVAGGITAHLSATGEGYSIQQPADVLAGFTPAGFSGLCVAPSGVFAADLLIAFDRPLTDIAMLYSPQEQGCDDSATLKISASLGANAIGSNTAVALVPGTWPTGTLSFSSAQPFDSVVVHYQSQPPTCQDWGPIFLVDQVTVTPAPEPSSAGAAAIASAALAALALPWGRQR